MSEFTRRMGAPDCPRCCVICPLRDARHFLDPEFWDEVLREETERFNALSHPDQKAEQDLAEALALARQNGGA